jgi:hypothetical protein
MMNPRVTKVEATNDFKLKVYFNNFEVRLFDTKPYLNKGIFTELKDLSYFKRVKVAFGSVEWPNEQDFSKDTLYLLGTPLDS